ncbi:hypothetical protein AGLY_015304, partial [Aphis glycines]
MFQVFSRSQGRLTIPPVSSPEAYIYFVNFFRVVEFLYFSLRKNTNNSILKMGSGHTMSLKLQYYLLELKYATAYLRPRVVHLRLEGYGQMRPKDKIIISTLIDKLSHAKQFLTMLRVYKTDNTCVLLSDGSCYSHIKFALTLHFYSPSAYDYVRSIFSKSLPHVSTLSKWYSTINGLPEFFSKSFKVISMKVEEMKKRGKIFGCMIMDEMSTRHQGCADYGLGNTARQADNLPFAKDAFVIVVVGMNISWKIPVAFYLLAGITTDEKASIILRLYKTGIKIKTLTFDGAANNLAMSNVLGAKLLYPDLKPSFELPSSKENIHIILDPCHMVKWTDWTSAAALLCKEN